MSILHHRTQCRACGGALRSVLDLGHNPLANALSKTVEEARSLPWYPLRMCMCSTCWMVQLDVAIAAEELFSHYVYETPRAASLEVHYAQLIDTMLHQYANGTSRVPTTCFEMGSNNGEFLRAIASHGGVEKMLGIEPAENIVELAKRNGLPTICEFFSMGTVEGIRRVHGRCDLFVARHCMAHLDDLRGTLLAIGEILNDDGVAVIENAYVMNTIRGAQFDQIYHEHMSYFAVTPMKKLLKSCGLYLQHVMLSPIHGGAVVLFASKAPGADASVERVINDERHLPSELDSFAFGAKACIAGLRAGLAELSHVTVDSYGATAKGNTLLNALGQTGRLVRYAVDSTPSKHGLYLPGTGIRVISEIEAKTMRPSTYLLTAWNYAAEIISKNTEFADAGGRWVVPLPFPKLVR